MDSRILVSRRRFLLGTAGVAAASLAPAVSLAIPAGARSTSVRIVNANGVHLRSGPALRFGVIRTLKSGDSVDFLGAVGSADGYEWSSVRFRRTGEAGYIASIFIMPPSGGSYPVGSSFHVDTANGGGANLRSAAGTSARVIKVVANGATGTIQDAPAQAEGYTWYKVNIAGSTGWLATVVMAPGPGGSGRPQIRVADGPLNVRSRPGLVGAVILTAATGATGEVTEAMPVEQDGYVWVNVRFFNQANTTGWVAQDFLAWT